MRKRRQRFDDEGQGWGRKITPDLENVRKQARDIFSIFGLFKFRPMPNKNLSTKRRNPTVEGHREESGEGKKRAFFRLTSFFSALSGGLPRNLKEGGR